MWTQAGWKPPHPAVEILQVCAFVLRASKGETQHIFNPVFFFKHTCLQDAFQSFMYICLDLVALLCYDFGFWWQALKINFDNFIKIANLLNDGLVSTLFYKQIKTPCRTLKCHEWEPVCLMDWDDLPACTLLLYLRDNVFLGCWCRLSAHKHSVVWMTAFTAALQELLKWTQPATDQVNVLQGGGGKHNLNLVWEKEYLEFQHHFSSEKHSDFQFITFLEIKTKYIN